MGARAVRTIEWLLLAAVVVCAVVISRDFVRYADHYPFLATDDSLANVSYVLATHGRYGFVASPTQGFTFSPRHQAFYNFGPYYFYVGAALIWLFGYSLTMLRGLHLIGILAIAAIGWKWFGSRGHAAAAALLAINLFVCFDAAQWPMVRPDIAVSLFAVLLIVAAGRGLEGGSATWWLLAGLGAGCAAATHLIAWALVPASLLLLALASATERPARSIGVRQLAGLIIGWTIAAASFYASFGFRFRDHLASLTGYGQFLARGEATFTDALRAHLSMAYTYLSPAGRLALGACVFAACALLARSFRLPQPARRRQLSLLAPPVTVLLCYLASLGRFPNYHAGYVILLQVSAWWCAAAALAAAEDRIADRRPRAAVAVRAVAAIALVVLAVVRSSSRPEAAWRLTRVHEWVSIADYTARIHELLPQRAIVWGTPQFGIENPDRVQLVQLAEGGIVLDRAHRAGLAIDEAILAPAYLVWGYPENRDHMSIMLRAAAGAPLPSVFGRLAEILPGTTYALTALVDAPPYGTTRVYARLDGAAAPPTMPIVRAYDAASGRWHTDVSGPIRFAFASTAPVVFESWGGAPTALVPADRSMRGEIEPGQYLVRIRVNPSSRATRRVVAITETASLRGPVGDLGPSAVMAPYGDHDREVYVVFTHGRGSVFVSQFDDGAEASIAGIDMFRLVTEGGQVEPVLFRSLPPLSAWVPLATLSVHAAAEGDALAVDGDASRQGYQVRSPPVATDPGVRVTVRAAVGVDAGVVCVGALNRTGAKWLATGGDPKTALTFRIDDSAGFQVVYYNCNTADAGNQRSRFHVAAPQYGVQASGFYVDTLMSVGAKAAAVLSAAPPPVVVRTYPARLAIRPERVAEMKSIAEAEVQFRAPIVRAAGQGWVIEGKAEGRYAYALTMKPRVVDADLRLVASGHLAAGGVTLGLLKDNQWAARVNVTTPGDFIAVVEPPGEGTYAAIIASNLPEQSLDNRVTLARVGWLPASALLK